MTIGLVLPVLGLLLAVSTVTSGGDRSIELAYFDVEAGQMVLVEYRAGDVLTSPIAGTQSYRVQLFTCSECRVVTQGMTVQDLAAQDMFVGYLMRDAPAPADDEFAESIEMRLLDGEEWVAMDTDRAADLIDQAFARCEPGTVKVCGVRPRR